MAWKTQFEKLQFIDDKPSIICSGCGELKSLTEFSPDKRRNLGIQARCRKCVAKYQANFRTKEQVRDGNLRTLYGINSEDYKKLYDYQEGKCLICKNHFDLLVVDHCHDSEKIRGLLCKNCNIGIGNLHDNIEYLENAIIYLKNFNNAK